MPSDKKIIFAPDFRTIYTNFVEAGFGPYDISLTLVESSIDDESTVVLKRLAKVIMSPAEAQTVVTIMQDAIRSYESTWGKIVQPVLHRGQAEGTTQGKTEGV